MKEPFYEMGSLFSLLQSGIRLHEDELRVIARDCVLGLHDLHTHGVMYYVSELHANHQCRISNRRICSLVKME